MFLSLRGKRLILKAIATARRFRFWLSAAVGLLLFFQIVAFNPKRLEEEVAPEAITQSDLKPREEDSIVAPTIPQDQVPEYTVEGFQYVSIQGGMKQWHIRAERAYFYTAEGIVHARDVNSEVYDAKGAITHIVSKEAKYFMQTKNLELFGDVKATLPSGLETLSPYMLYEAATKDLSVPIAYPITGKSVPRTDPKGKHTEASFGEERFDFSAKGMKSSGVNDTVYLLSNVKVNVYKDSPGKANEVTTIESDRAEIDKKKNIGRFSMLEARPAELRFVTINQPGMIARSRRAEFRINANPKKIRTLRALDDVKIEEKNQEPSDYATNARRRSNEARTRYSTSGIAEFDTFKNLIILRDYPQVYQDHDTITGDTIIVHRDSDLVEVDHSNAFSEGQPQNDEGKQTRE